jgi:hypothetical protein
MERRRHGTEWDRESTHLWAGNGRSVDGAIVSYKRINNPFLCSGYSTSAHSNAIDHITTTTTIIATASYWEVSVPGGQGPAPCGVIDPAGQLHTHQSTDRRTNTESDTRQRQRQTERERGRRWAKEGRYALVASEATLRSREIVVEGHVLDDA